LTLDSLGDDGIVMNPVVLVSMRLLAPFSILFTS
jgi:hypothetical protein